MTASPFVLLGPTASGKTAIALPLARKLEADILSVDSRQIYRGMEIGSAAPSPEERAQVTHHLVAEADPREAMSAGEFGRRARAILAELCARGRPALLVGGSGLYLRAALGGLDAALAPDGRVQESLRERLAKEGAAALHAELTQRDPETAARIGPGDAQRIARALEILEVSGEKPSVLRTQGKLAESAAQIVVLDRDRDDLERRIRRRVQAMIDAGLEAEVRALLALGLDAGTPVLKSVGYAETIRYLRGEIDRGTWIETISVNTRRFAKRQRTWFRGLVSAVWVRVGEHEDPEATADHIARLWAS